jgi:hypothetical protein
MDNPFLCSRSSVMMRCDREAALSLIGCSGPKPTNLAAAYFRYAAAVAPTPRGEVLKPLRCFLDIQSGYEIISMFSFDSIDSCFCTRGVLRLFPDPAADAVCVYPHAE